jgi:ParB/RepB/Spo0J family partition protein
MVSKSRLPDPRTLPPDPILEGLTFERPVVPTSFIKQASERELDRLKELERRVQELERERREGGVILKLDPKKVGRSSMANRDLRSVTPGDPDFDELVDSIRTFGQDTPIVVRPAPSGADYEYLIVEGHRRHAACLLLDQERPDGFGVQARLLEAAVDPETHFLRMFRENEDRKNPSAYERGLMLRSALATGLVKNVADLAQKVRRSEVLIYKCLQVAELPAEIHVAFGDPRVITFHWGQALQAALTENRDAVIECAKQLAVRDPSSPSPQEVFTALIKAVKPAEDDREETVKINGQVFFRLKRMPNGSFQCSFGRKIDKRLRHDLAAEVKDFVEKRLKERIT